MPENTPDARAYLKSVELVREAIEENAADWRFARRSQQQGRSTPEIVYLFDTNVCEAYVSPGGAFHYGRIGFRGLFNDTEADLIDRMWPRLLFEGTLPGQIGSIMVSPEHWDELANRIKTLLSKQIGTLADGRLPDAIQKLSKFSGDYTELVAQAEALGLASALASISETIDLRHRVRVLFGDRPDGKRRLTSLTRSEHWAAAEDKVRYEDFAFWRAAIVKRLEKNRRKDRTIENDALTIAYIETMYRAMDTTRRTKFVFVTADRAIIEAIADNMARLTEAGIKNFIRSPDNYMPLVNYRFLEDRLMHADEQGPDWDTANFIREVEMALQAALEPNSDSENGRIDKTKEGWRSVKDRWSKAARLLSYAGATYFAADDEHASTKTRHVLELFQSPDVLKTLASQIYETLDHIQEDNARQNMIVTLERLVKEMRSIGSVNRRDWRRAPIRLLDVNPLAGLASDTSTRIEQFRSMDAFLDRIAEGEADHGRLIQGLIGDINRGWETGESRHEALLLAACIYFSARKWTSARLCAQIARTGISRAVRNYRIWEREARFAEALSLRMTLLSGREFRTAKELLNANLALPNHDLAKERDRLEKGALLLTASVMQAIEFATPFESLGRKQTMIEVIERSKVADEFDDGYDDTVAATRNIEDSFLSAQSFEEASHLIVRGKSNILGALVAKHFLSEVSNSIATLYELEFALEASDAAHDEFGFSERALPSIYSAAARIILSPTRERLTAFEALIIRYQDNGKDAVYWTAPDQIEVEFLRRSVTRLVEFGA